MKQKLFITLTLLSVVFCYRAAALPQPPEFSTSANPQWYYIQLQGSSAATNSYLTANAGQLQGNPLAESGLAEVNKQLWRVEIVTTGSYRIVNKYYSENMDAVYDSEKGASTVLLSSNSSVQWRLSTVGDFYVLRISVQPAGGTSGYVYLTREASGEILLGASTNTAATKVKFVAFGNSYILSNGGDNVWYNLLSARSGYTDKCITDVTADNEAVKFAVLPRETDNRYQQWKVVAKNPASGNGLVDFINRATGNLIHTASVCGENAYYYSLFTTLPDESSGWTIQAKNDGRYEISTTDDVTGLTKYWNLTNEGEIPEVYLPGYNENTGFEWTFDWAGEETKTSLSPLPAASVRIYSAQRRIYVESEDTYTITTIYGAPVAHDVDLPAGVYLVGIGNQITKILVK
ncbi:MAG: hypothetical protein LBM08_13120 [Dysgonamonadaceae bacterium]|nr:hypothetical protein [Dysgonamonadaceae bacterium]